MILRHGARPHGRQILHPKTVEQMSVNQIGDLSAGKLKTFTPERFRATSISNPAPPKNGV